MYSLEELKTQFETYLQAESKDQAPENLYKPVNYILQLPGKRIRPVLVLAGANLYQDKIDNALTAAYAVEMFHNFSLVHDDIMDAAPLRRGQASVHIKWDENAAILSGDVMLIKAIEYLHPYEGKLYKDLLQLFTEKSIQVCEGQRWDMDFETQDDVSIDDYIKMIEYKTAVLIGAALQMGSMIGGADEEDAKHIYEFGRNIGISFQIQDDLLDVFGDSPAVGKQKAGDIIHNKKTYLYLKALELLSDTQADRLREIYLSGAQMENEAKIAEVTQLMKTAQVHIYSEELKEAYLTLGLSHLDAIKVPKENKTMLREFATYLLKRKF